METMKTKEYSINTLLLTTLTTFVFGLLFISLWQFSLKNIASFILGSVIVILNLYWLKRLALKLVSEGGFKKKLAIEWAGKILFVFGAIAIIILKTEINILIFIFGLSILPIAILFNSVVLYFKR